MQFTQIDADLPTRIEGHAPLSRHVSGETLFWEGDSAGVIFRIEEGCVRAFRYSEDGERQILALFWPGEVFGVPINGAYSYSAEVVSPIKFRTISLPSGDDLAAGWVSRSMHTALNCEINAFQTRSEFVGRLGARTRVACFLTHVAKHVFLGSDKATIHLPQTDIADYLALTPETVCRTLQAFKKVGAIDMPKRDQIRVLDVGQLAQMLS